LQIPVDVGMQYGRTIPHAPHVIRALSALPIAASCAGLAVRFGSAKAVRYR